MRPVIYVIGAMRASLMIARVNAIVLDASMRRCEAREMARQAGGGGSTTLRRLINGYQVSQAIHVAVTLGIPDLLGRGRLPPGDVAAATDAHPDAIYRLLRALASVGVLDEDEQGCFSLTEAGNGLRTDAPGSLAGWAAFIGRSPHWQAWGHLLHTVRSGENAFAAVHGVDVWSYRADHPAEGAIFDRAMANLTRFAHTALLSAY